MTKDKHNWDYLMVFSLPTGLDHNPKGIRHSKKCRECKKTFIYKTGIEWDKQQITFQLGIKFKKEKGKMFFPDTTPTILYN